MSNKDTLTGKWSAEFYFYDEYNIGESSEVEINIESAPVFSSEADAAHAEDHAFDTFMATLRFCGQERRAVLIHKGNKEKG